MQTFGKLPRTLPIFPLANAVVMPGGQLPLNIFETRYLNMLQDAMKNHQLIGMIQPRGGEKNSELFKVGCAARITRYDETNDGRIEISLAGLCRFEVKEELVTTRGYRLVVPDWTNFEVDYKEQSEPDSASQFSFLNMLRNHFKQANMEIDWAVMEKLSTENLFNALFYFLELSDADKQMLVEMDTLAQRVKAITAILESNIEEIPTQH